MPSCLAAAEDPAVALPWAEVEVVFREERLGTRLVTLQQQRPSELAAKCFLMAFLVFRLIVKRRKMKKPCRALNTSVTNLEEDGIIVGI